jgi:hypothetical protein
MRGRQVLVLVLLFVAVATVAAWLTWAFQAGARIGLGWTGLRSALPYLLAGVATVEVVIVAFVWLAFYSQRHGYDDRAGMDQQ